METDKIGEIREWLVEINTNQLHHTKILESTQAQSHRALTVGLNAEDKADRALTKTRNQHDELEKYKYEQNKERKWFIGTVLTLGGLGLTIFMFLTPVLVSYYN